MKYPRFVAEMASEANRPRLHMGVRSGYALALVFGLVAMAGQWLGILPAGLSFFVLVFAKVVTNSLAWAALRFERFVMPLSALNTAADAFVMTGAIYVTGGLASPLFVLYVLLLTVLALLTNTGITMVMAGLCLVLYATMTVLVSVGVLTQHASPIEVAQLTSSHVVLGVVFATLILLLTTLYTTAILRELRDKQRQLEQRTDLLVEASRQKSQFMANITHELRTPIHGITAVSELFESEIYGPISDRQREAQRSIQQSALSLLERVDELLLLAKADAGKLELSAAEVDVGELARGLTASVRGMIEVKSQTLAADIPDDLPKTVTDRGKLNQVLLNLLANAIKFTPEGGTIELSVHATSTTVVFEVSDTGMGIAESEVERIFEPFHQVDGTDERSYGGAGLGLAVVQRLCAVIGAAVSVHSKLGRGAVFTITVPRVLDTEAHLPSAAQ